MNPTLRYYLGEVLGLDLVPREAMTASQTTSKALVQADLVTILSAHSLNDAEKALLKKMMQAIGVSEYVVSEMAKPGPGIGLVFGNASAESLGLNQLGANIEFNHRRWLRTYSFNDLLNGSEGEIQSRKRTTWAHLQTIKTWLKECAH